VDGKPCVATAAAIRPVRGNAKWFIGFGDIEGESCEDWSQELAALLTGFDQPDSGIQRMLWTLHKMSFLAYNDIENHFYRFAIVIFIPAVFSLEASLRAR
jgi:hypothetical protein